MFAILFGPPGCGKGTQAASLSKEFNVPSLSTGDLLRAEAATGTPKGQCIGWLINHGYLVPDELVNHMVFDRLETPKYSKGVILDGYPRTTQQAAALDRWLGAHGRKLDHVIEMAVDEEALVARRAGRLYAPKSKRTYHAVFNPPKVPGRCDETGEELVHRDDDRPDVVRHRLEAYRDVTAPVLDYYRTSKRVRTVDGMADIENVYAQILSLLR